MTILRALFRTMVVGLSIWIGQNLVPANTTGIWAMVSLGIASAIGGVILTRYMAHTKHRGQEAILQFVATSVILELYYLLLPKHPAMEAADAALAALVGVASGISEWLVPDVRASTTRRT